MDSKNGGKYALRTKSIIKRIESEKNRATSRRREPKEKQKPPPLSKYRRKTANARERNRMKEINDAFVTLQKSIPDLPGTDAEKLTKITVLRLAVNYINALAGVLNEDECYNPTDIEDVRELWCLENAHMARPEHCVRPVIRTSKVTVSSANKPTKCSVNIKPQQNKVTKPKCPSSLTKTNDSKTKSTIGGKLVTNKRPSKSKSKTKVCKTASIATSNGAYITLKNVALQTPAHRLGKHADNEPLMMSMTVKRPRMESYTGPREAKLPRLEPVVPTTTLHHHHHHHHHLQQHQHQQHQHQHHHQPQHHQPQHQHHQHQHQHQNQHQHQPLLALTPCVTEQCQVPSSIPGHNIPEPLMGATPFTPRRVVLPSTSGTSTTTTTTTTNLHFHNTTDYIPTTNILQDLDSPVVRNDVLLEFPRSGRHFSDSSCADSAFSSEGSEPPSPLSGVTFSMPIPVPVGDSSPAFSVTSSDFSASGSTSDCDSVLTAPVELGSLLGDEPFEEELDHLTSTFAEGDDTLNLFLAHSTSNFIYADIDDC
ncbi:hypothetical protein Pcinc_036632 [Petrolisthes cinctipes]|uniref:BHLH domain-containing protein n=1 Tax=Petrolisthes cinctipes TaxID=88211 RepID=A0AAE1ELS0_PETCI|nr:hypothetical protein Pcinc_043046 [Petrolisthes cinctipes]KAK3857097.1 hypothetical protein Pcinc_036632 [Petrolisthes cinctipes]